VANHPERGRPADIVSLANVEQGRLAPARPSEDAMSVGTIVLIILILLLIGALPSWPYSSGWGYYPSGGLGLVVIILLILVLLGKL
jgi:hypothetical protein